MNRRCFITTVASLCVVGLPPARAKTPLFRDLQRRRLGPSVQKVTFVAKSSEGFGEAISLRSTGNAIWLASARQIARDGSSLSVTLRRNLPAGQTITLPVEIGAREIEFAVVCLPLKQACTTLELVDAGPIAKQPSEKTERYLS